MGKDADSLILPELKRARRRGLLVEGVDDVDENSTRIVVLKNWVRVGVYWISNPNPTVPIHFL